MIAYKARRANGYIKINGLEIWSDIKNYVEEISYTDAASGETDSIDVILSDKDKKFSDAWLIQTGDRIEAEILFISPIKDGYNETLYCGEFLCDTREIEGFPLTVTARGLALPVIGTKNTKKWENISVSAIAEDICSWLGAELKYYADDITVESVSQSRQTDIEFLYKLCKDYGFGMKTYRNSIVIFDRERQDAAEAAAEIDLTRSYGSFTLTDSGEAVYTGAQCNYKTENSDNEITVTVGTQERMIVLDSTAKSEKEARLKANAALYDANAERITLKVTAPYRGLFIYSGTNYHITGLGAYNGKYAADKVEHTLSGKAGYEYSATFHAVELDKDLANETAEPQTARSGEAGERLELLAAGLYISSDAASPVRTVSGTYYLYDGEEINSRYRVCADINDIGVTPVGEHVDGWIDGEHVR